MPKKGETQGAEAAEATPESSVEVVKVRPNGRDSDPIEVKYELPHDLGGLVDKFGESVVASKAREKIVINLQDRLRGAAKSAQESGEEVDLQAVADAWLPGVRPRGASKAEKAKNLFASLSKEDREALLAELQG